jgi:Flp pilus assembly protein TadG
MIRSDGRTTRGQALAEFAIVLPIFILLLFALFDLGRVVFGYNSITNAAREGARMAIVNQDFDTITERVEGQTFVVEPTTSVTFWDAQDDAVCSTVETGCIAIITVTTEVEMMTPVIGDIIGPLTLTAESQIPVDFVCPNPVIQAFDTVLECPKQS